MGNNCIGPTLSGKGFFQSLTAFVWRTRPREPPPSSRENTSPQDPATSDSKDVVSVDLEPIKMSSNKRTEVQSTPPKTVKIPPQELRPVEREEPVRVEAKEAAAPVNDKPPKEERLNKTAHRRVSSVGLLVSSVLGRKPDNLNYVYSLGWKLGQGQFGTTFFCLDKKTAKEYTCKSIAKRKLTTDEDVENVRREIQIMHHLAGHPNVISIVDAYEDAVAVHVVMELCAGRELFDRIIQRGHYCDI